MTWEKVKLGDVCEIERKGIEASRITSGTTYVGLENIQRSGEFANVTTVENGEIASTKFCFTPCHILYGKLRPYLSKIALPDFEGVCSTDILPLLPSERMERSFIFHFLRLPDIVELATSRSSGANLPRLSPKALADFEIPLPPLAEQKRLAAILDRADELRRARRSTLARLDELAQSLFLELFGDPRRNEREWPTHPIGSFIYDMRGGAALKPEDFTDSGFPILHKGAIKARGFISIDEKKKTFATLAYADSSPKNIVNRDFMAVTLRDLVPSGPSIGLTANLRNGPFDEYLLAQGTYGFRVDESKVTPEFLVYLSNNENFRHVFRQNSVGSTQIHIRTPIYLSIRIPLPPLALQQQFAEQIAELETIKTRARASLVELDALFASLQARVFSGELSGVA